MIRPLLLIVPFSFAILYATAQPPTPVPSLDELLRLYEKYELPMPPKDAKFVRYELYTHAQDRDGNPIQAFQSFAFLISPRTRTREAMIFDGTVWGDIFPLVGMWEIKPKVTSLFLLKTLQEKDLITAIQAHKLGHRELANYLYVRFRKGTDPSSPQTIIRNIAWEHWQQQMKKPGTDRKIILNRLKDLATDGYVFHQDQTPTLKEYLHAFELSEAPGKGKNGTPEALIDDLVDVCGAFYSLWLLPKDDMRLRKIAERGFDAVPALLAHLDDPRLTRAELHLSFSFVTTPVTVGDLCGALLQNLAAGDIPKDVAKEERERTERIKMFERIKKETGQSVGKAGAMIVKPQAITVSLKDSKAWWDKVQKTGEKQHALSHIFPKVTVDGVDRTVHQVPLAVIRAKYPNELAALYRKALENPTDNLHYDIVKAVADSALAQKEKRAILEFGLQQKDCRKRYAAFGELAKVDPREFEEKLLALFDAYPSKNPDGDWECLGRSPVGFSMLSATPKILASLEKAMKRVPVDLRLMLLSWLSKFIDDDDRRLIRIQLLTQFLDDAEVCPKTKRETERSEGLGEEYDGIEVRNFAAIKLAEYYHERIENDRKRTADEWKAIRERLRRETIAELAESKR